VLDFGIAKLAQAQDSGVKTQSLMCFGTPRYMSPSSVRSAAQHRSPQRHLRAWLHSSTSWSSAAPPFEGETGELIAKHQLVAPSTARSINPGVSEESRQPDLEAAREGSRPGGRRR